MHKKIKVAFTLILFCLSSTTFSATIVGDWKINPDEGALGVGPVRGDTSWFSTNDNNPALRQPCNLDDIFRFNEDGSYEVILGEETWLESWQVGVVDDGCGTPVSPHDGSNSATFTFDTYANTLTIVGEGAYIGLPKATNQGEDGVATDNTIVYLVSNLMINNNTAISMVLDIDYGYGWWRIHLIRDGFNSIPLSYATLDVDQDGMVSALTDGLMILRYLFRVTGDSLVSDTIGEGAQRTDPNEVEAYLDSLMP